MSNGTTADGFDFPCGAPDGVGYYVAAGVAEEAYYERFGAWHTGEDWTGLGGGDSDLGDPVQATANGQVVASEYFPPSWGNIVLIEHQRRQIVGAVEQIADPGLTTDRHT